MFGAKTSVAASGDGQNLTAAIQRIVQGHEQNQPFEKADSREPWANALNALIDKVNEEVDYQKFRIRTINAAVHSGLWYMKINADFSIAYAIWSDEFRRMVGFRDESDFPNTVEAWSSRLHRMTSITVCRCATAATSGFMPRAMSCATGAVIPRRSSACSSTSTRRSRTRSISITR